MIALNDPRYNTILISPITVSACIPTSETEYIIVYSANYTPAIEWAAYTEIPPAPEYIEPENPCDPPQPQEVPGSYFVDCPQLKPGEVEPREKPRAVD